MAPVRREGERERQPVAPHSPRVSVERERRREQDGVVDDGWESKCAGEVSACFFLLCRLLPASCCLFFLRTIARGHAMLCKLRGTASACIAFWWFFTFSSFCSVWFRSCSLAVCFFLHPRCFRILLFTSNQDHLLPPSTCTSRLALGLTREKGGTPRHHLSCACLSVSRPCDFECARLLDTTGKWCFVPPLGALGWVFGGVSGGCFV